MNYVESLVRVLSEVTEGKCPQKDRLTFQFTGNQLHCFLSLKTDISVLSRRSNHRRTQRATW